MAAGLRPQRGAVGGVSELRPSRGLRRFPGRRGRPPAPRRSTRAAAMRLAVVLHQVVVDRPAGDASSTSRLASATAPGAQASISAAMRSRGGVQGRAVGDDRSR